MKIMDMPRGTGKTSTLFYLSQLHKTPVVTTAAAIKLYKDRYPEAIAMTYEEFLSLYKKPERIYLDEINFFMLTAFPNTKILIASCSNDNDGVEHIEEFYPKH